LSPQERVTEIRLRGNWYKTSKLVDLSFLWTYLRGELATKPQKGDLPTYGGIGMYKPKKMSISQLGVWAI